MEIENKTVSASGNKRSFLSVLKKKWKRITAAATTSAMMWMMTAVSAFAEGEGIDDTAGSEQFNAVIKFFGTWIGRIGLVVGFVGAVMFGLAIKNDDADAKTRGLMTLASGFVVFAISKAVSFFMEQA